MDRSSNARRGKINLAGIGLSIGDELGNGFDWKRRVHQQNIGCAKDPRDRRNVADEIEIEVVVQRRTNHIAGGNQKERISIGGGTHDRLCADVGACSRPVLDDKWLAESLRQPLSDQAREDVDRIARGTRYDNAHQSGGVRLRPSDARDRRQRGNACGQTQEFAARKFHLNLPLHYSITSSARASSVSGTSRPSALAVLRLITSSNLVGACTGSSAGVAPLRMRSTYDAASRNSSTCSTPYDISPPSTTANRYEEMAGNRRWATKAMI